MGNVILDGLSLAMQVAGRSFYNGGLLESQSGGCFQWHERLILRALALLE